ncbi:MAG: hypothetical protein LUH36_00320 [Oscillospiraceae bacterium]|nr:hypothetical protein [Oscillospiraceae bacterium]
MIQHYYTWNPFYAQAGFEPAAGINVNRRCTVTYDPGDGSKEDVWTKKPVTSSADTATIETRKQLEQIATQKTEIQKLLKLPSSKQISIPAKQIDTSSLDIDLDHIIKSGHTATKESAVAWIEDAKFSIEVWNGQYTRFIAQNGATYVDNTGNYIRTAYSREEFTTNLIKALEVLDDGEN